MHRRKGGGGASAGDAADPGDGEEKLKQWSAGRFLKQVTRRGGLLGSPKALALVLVAVLVLALLAMSPKDMAKLIKRRGKAKGGSRGVTAPPTEPVLEAMYSHAELDAALRKLRSNRTGLGALVEAKKLTVSMARPYRYNGHRSFGCMRDTCRGLEIEDLFDRGFHRYFRTALKNDSSAGYNMKSNYKVTVLLLDTTQLNHMKSAAPALFKRVWETQGASTYVIAFEGGDAMGGNKGFQLRQKDRFTREFKCSYDTLRIQPTQYRLYIKNECEALLARSRGDKTTSFLLKPEAGSQGQGITFHSSADEIIEKRAEFFPCENRHGIPATSRFLVQEYIAKPLLLNKCKFDARVYLFASSADPFFLWYHRGYLRRSLTPYTPTTRDRKAYLTNTHFQSSRANFNMSEHIWTFDRMQATLLKQRQGAHGFVETVIEPWMKEVARFVFESAREKLTPRKGSSQIIGLDFMLDEQLHLHFLEANGYPGFTWSINFDTRSMVEDLFDLMTEQAEAPSPFRMYRPGDRFGGFQLFHSDIRPHHIPYNPCYQLADNLLLSKAVFAANKFALSTSAQPVNPNELDDDLVNAIETYPIRTRCSAFVVDAKGLACPFEPPSSIKDSDLPNRIVMLGTQKNKPIVLFQNVTAFATYMASSEECSKAAGSVTTLLDHKAELRLVLENVAYPTGRKPLVPYLRDDPKKEIFDTSAATDFTPDPKDPVFIRAERISKLFQESFPGITQDARVVYRIRWFFLVTRPPVMAFTHPGFAFSVRRVRCNPGFDTWRQGEHVLDLDFYQDVLTSMKATHSRYVVSLLEPVVRRVAEDIIADVVLKNEAEKSGAFQSSLFAMDWTVDGQTMKPRLLGIKHVSEKTDGDFADIFGTSKGVMEQLFKARERLESILKNAPTFFARARRGDGFENFRFVRNHFEWSRFEDAERPMLCTDPFPGRKDLDFAINFENVPLKRRNAIRRDLHKRLIKRWMVCRVKRNEEAKRSCMRPLLRERYRLIVKKLHLLSNEEHWIENTFQGLLNSKARDDDDDDDGPRGRGGSSGDVEDV